MLFHDITHKILSYLYFIIVKYIRSDLRFVGSKIFTNKYKNSNTVFAMGTGMSINEYSERDFEQISMYDSIGVNFFLFHHFKPSFYFMEIHKTSIGLFDTLNKKQDRVSTIPYFYRGYSSPKSLLNMISNIRSIPKTQKYFLILKDAWIKGDWDSVPRHLIDKILDPKKTDFFYNYIGTILFLIFFSYKVGYKKIVLCGFDMDHNYFYCTDEKYKPEANALNLCNESAFNKISADPMKRKTVLDILIFMNEKFKKARNGGVYVYSKNMSLSKFLPVYEYENK
jgi:hypothetical protein